MAADMKECPQCAESIKAKAVRCRFCGYTFSEEPATAKQADVDFEEDIASFKKEQQKGRKVGKFFLFLFLFLLVGTLGWFLESKGWIDLAFYKLTKGRYSADLMYLPCIRPVALREGRVPGAISARGPAQRSNVYRELARPGAARKGLAIARTEGTAHKVTRSFADVNALINLAGMEPDNPNNNYNIGTGYLVNFEPGKAVDYLIKATGVLPDDFEAFTNLAIAYFRQEVYDQCQLEVQRALDLDQNNGTAVNLLGLCCLERNQLTDALRHFQAAINDQPDLADSYVNLGNVYMAQENTAMAKEKYRQAMAMNPGNGVASCNLACILYKEGKYQEALKYWEQALDHARLIDNKSVVKIDKNIKVAQKKIL